MTILGGEETSMVAAPPPRRPVSALELLAVREQQWASRLGGVSLICELEPEPAQCAEILRALGRVYSHRWAKGLDPRPHFLRHPHAVVVGMAGFAIDGYANGNFWSRFWAAVEYPGTTDDNACWGNTFIEALTALGLPTFRELAGRAGHRYVTPVLMHTGIPNACLNDFLTLVSERRRIARLAPDEFVDWAAQRAAADRLTGVDMPVQRFLQYGGSYAIDLVDRVYDLFDRLADGNEDTGDLLPTRFVERARALIDSTPAKRRGSVVPSRQRAPQRPQVMLDPHGDGVVLRLPPVTDLGDSVRWHLVADGEHVEVRSSPHWPGAVEGAPATDYALARPVGEVQVTLGGSSVEYAVPVIDRALPLLAFDAEGRRLSAAVPLPRAAVWLLHPDAAGAGALTVEGAGRIVAEGALPFGWVGWRLCLVDLAEARTVALDGFGRVWPVAATAAARVEVDPPVAGVRSVNGAPVHHRLPQIVLPQDGDTLSWEVEVSRFADGFVLARLSVPPGADPNAVWDRLPRPALGTFVVHVRGPLGRSARRVVALAEGLGVTSTPNRRWITARGLVPAVLQLTGPPGLTLSTDRLDFTADVTTAQVVAHAPEASATLVLTPPHMAVMHDRGGLATAWRTSPLSLVAEDLIERPGALVVQVGDAIYTRLVVIAGGEIVQDLAPKGAARGGAIRFDLAQIGDTLRRHGQVQLALGDVTGGLCGTVRPRQLAHGVAWDGDELLFERCAAVDLLTAGVYAYGAPWRGVTPMAVTEGRVALPQWLADAGPLLVALRVEDPWVPDEWPQWPRLGAGVFMLAGQGEIDGDEEERRLAGFLAGAAALPARIVRPERFWRVLDLIEELVPRDRVPAAVTAIGAALATDPVSSLTALSTLALPRGRATAALIRSGLAESAPASDDHRVAARAWGRAPAVAAVLTGARLQARDEDTDEELLDLRQAARDRCGDVLDAIIAGTGDPFGGAGRFGPTEERLAFLPAEQLVRLRAETALVPRGLLDADTRAGAAWTLLEARFAPQLLPCIDTIAEYVCEIDAFLGVGSGSTAARAFRARLHPDRRGGWQALPAFSLGAALIARAAALGDDASAQVTGRYREAWSLLAGVAPDLVTVDLVLAEALTRGMAFRA